MPYRRLDDALALANRGKGSLVASLFTYDPAVATRGGAGVGAWHGRVLFADRDSAQGSRPATARRCRT